MAITRVALGGSGGAYPAFAPKDEVAGSGSAAFLPLMGAGGVLWAAIGLTLWSLWKE